MRIVSLCPSLTEMVFDFGLGDDLVGITKFCVHPADRVGAVEQVGGTKDPDVARIVELAPDVVLVNEEENRREDAEALTAAGIRIVNSFPKDAAGTAAMVRKYGRVLEVPEAAEVIALDIEARAAAVTERAAARATNGGPRTFAYLIWRKPWMSLNADTFPSNLLSMAGGLNAFAAHPERFPEITVEELAAAAPDRVLLSTEPFPFAEKHIAELSAATGIEAGRFAIVDGEYLSWHGSRTPAGIDYAESVLWGDPAE